MSIGDVTARRAIVDVGAQTTGRFIGLALSVVATLWIVRWLGPDEFGRWATLLAIIQICGYLGESGLQLTVVREAARKPEREGVLLGALLALRLALCVPAALAALVAILVIADSGPMFTAGLVLIAGMLLSAPAALSAVFQLRVRNDLTAATGLANSVLWLVIVLILTGYRPNLATLAAGLVAAQAAQTCLQLHLARRMLTQRLQWRKAQFLRTLRAALPLGVATLLVVSYTKIDQVLVYEIAGPRDASLYGAVCRVLDQARLLPLALVTTLLPLVSQALMSDRTRAERMLASSVRFVIMMTLPPLAISLVLSEDLVVVLFGVPYMEAGPALPILMGVFVLTSLVLLLAQLMIALGEGGKLARFALIGLVVNVAANVILLPAGGFILAAWITLATEALVLVLAASSVSRIMPIRFISPSVLRTALAALLMAVCCEILRSLGVPLIVNLALSTVIYCALLFVVGGITRADIRLFRKGMPESETRV